MIIGIIDTDLMHHTSMKKTIKLICIILVFFLTACNSNVEKITDYSNLNPSMQLFNNLECVAFEESDCFGTKIVYADKSEDGAYYYYSYKVCFAPIVTNKNVDIKSITLENSSEIEKQLFNNGTSMPDGNTIDSYFDEVLFKNEKDFEAFEWSFTRAISKESLERLGISEKQLDEYMASVKITIKYNNTEDILLLSVPSFGDGNTDLSNIISILKQ